MSCPGLRCFLGFPGDTGVKAKFTRFKRLQFHLWIRKIPWTRKWKPTPFLPGKFHGQRSLEGYSPWGCKESDMAEHTHPRCFLG